MVQPARLAARRREYLVNAPTSLVAAYASTGPDRVSNLRFDANTDGKFFIDGWFATIDLVV